MDDNPVRADAKTSPGGEIRVDPKFNILTNKSNRRPVQTWLIRKHPMSSTADIVEIGFDKMCNVVQREFSIWYTENWPFCQKKVPLDS